MILICLVLFCEFGHTFLGSIIFDRLVSIHFLRNSRVHVSHDHAVSIHILPYPMLQVVASSMDYGYLISVTPSNLILISHA